MLSNLLMAKIQAWRLRIPQPTWCTYWHPKNYIYLFTAMEWSSHGIQLAKVFHIASTILEAKTFLFSFIVAQATEVDEKITKQWEKLAAEAIMSFDAHISNDRGLITFYDSPKSVGATYWFDVATMSICKRRGIRPGIMRMVKVSTFWWSVGLEVILFRLHPSVWWWIRGHNLLWLAKDLP